MASVTVAMKLSNKDILADLSILETFDRKSLKQLWVRLFDDLPKPRSQDLSIRKIAWHIQMKAHGGLSAPTRTKINRLISGKSRAPRDQYSLKSGAHITRTWNGQTYKVTVNGKNKFEYNGKNYRSLSAIARKITGAHWSGPLFFGLNKQKSKQTEGADVQIAEA